MAQIKITQIKSRINAPKVQKLTLDALGLRTVSYTHLTLPTILRV